LWGGAALEDPGKGSGLWGMGRVFGWVSELTVRVGSVAIFVSNVAAVGAILAAEVGSCSRFEL
jgi:hypothetical protein